jgi:hypothetical protein
VIVIEGSWWPLLFVGDAADAAAARRTAVLVDERCLELSDDLRIALVVAGTGTAALRAHRNMLAWLRRCGQSLEPRTRRLAWVIEDDECRAWTSAWLRLSSAPLFNAPCDTFRTVVQAFDLLLSPANRTAAHPVSRHVGPFERP